VKVSQSGFTLIEIAIVLVVIGLLVGGIIKGQSLIDSAKMKSLANDFRNIPVYVYGYEDMFKSVPGDEDQNELNRQFAPAGTATACTPAATSHCVMDNGMIDGGWDANSIADESFVFWQQIRLAGFYNGPTSVSDPDYRPTNAVGGYIGVTNALQSPINNMKGAIIICSDDIPGKLAKRLDITLDDGNTQTGYLQVVAAGTPSSAPVNPLATANISDDTPYLVCMSQ
jgi:prepilin-type N-terminal cleavage/methylation domain-containing protein